VRRLSRTSTLALSVLLMSAAAFLAFQSTEHAQAADNVVTIEATAKEKISLRIVGDRELEFGNLEPEESAQRSTLANVRCNKSWDLTYEAQGMDEGKGMPLSQLKWSDTETGEGVTIDKNGTFLSNQPKASNNNGRDITHYYTLEMPWTADPGKYSASITYTATMR
jgi:hypothetical protein